MNAAIGGYFEIEFPARKGMLYPQAQGFQSARAAFLALLRAGRPGRIWVPHYICDSMLAASRQARVEAAFYRIGPSFRLAEAVDIAENDWFVYVNYFGLCDAYVDELLSKFDRRKLIVDCSQALFSPPRECLATFYSPRKFVGVPDGGLLVSSLEVNSPALRDGGSFGRALPLLKRLASSPEEAYADHKLAEQTLFEQEPKRMSHLTSSILSTVDYEQIRRCRNRNFSLLHQLLGEHNLLTLDSDVVDGALCYPLLTEVAGLKNHLIERRMFIPTYWPDVLERVDPSSHEAALVRNLVPLPCDQRYGRKEMERIADACLEFLCK